MCRTARAVHTFQFHNVAVQGRVDEPNDGRSDFQRHEKYWQPHLHGHCGLGGPETVDDFVASVDEFLHGRLRRIDVGHGQNAGFRPVHVDSRDPLVDVRPVVRARCRIAQLDSDGRNVRSQRQDQGRSVVRRMSGHCVLCAGQRIHHSHRFHGRLRELCDIQRVQHDLGVHSANHHDRDQRQNIYGNPTETEQLIVALVMPQSAV